MKELIITIFIISIIILGINILKYVEHLIIDIIYIKSNEETKKSMNRKIENQEEKLIYYLKEINNLKYEIERLRNENNNNNTTN